jgi:hypothetical protein
MIDDERCPFYWWARSARAGLVHGGWPVLWVRSPGQRVLTRYAGTPMAAPVYWGDHLSILEAQNAGEGEV